MIGALQRLGADRCDRCGDWDVNTWSMFDHCSCIKCLSADPGWPLEDEELEENEVNEMANSIVRFFLGRGMPVKFNGLLLDAYKQIHARS